MQIKNILSIAFIVGLFLTTPTHAELEQMHTSMHTMENPHVGELQTHVGNALDAHKAMASHELQAHHEEVKGFVSDAIKQKILAEEEIIKDTDQMNEMEAIEYLVKKADFEKQTLTACAEYKVSKVSDLELWQFRRCAQPMIEDNDNAGKFAGTCFSDCTGSRWIFQDGTCKNPNFLQACKVVCCTQHSNKVGNCMSSYKQSCW